MVNIARVKVYGMMMIIMVMFFLIKFSIPFETKIARFFFLFLFWTNFFFLFIRLFIYLFIGQSHRVSFLQSASQIRQALIGLLSKRIHLFFIYYYERAANSLFRFFFFFRFFCLFLEKTTNKQKLTIGLGRLNRSIVIFCFHLFSKRKTERERETQEEKIN